MIEGNGTPLAAGPDPRSRTPTSDRGTKRPHSRSPETGNSPKKYPKHQHEDSETQRTTVQGVTRPISDSNKQTQGNGSRTFPDSNRTAACSSNKAGVDKSLPEQNNVELANKTLTTSIDDTLMEFYDQGAHLAAFQTSVHQAEAQLKRAVRQYNGVKHFFPTYPAMEENKERAKKRASDYLDSQRKRLEDERIKQTAIAVRIPDVIRDLIQNQIKEGIARTDHVSRDQYAKLEERCKQLEKSLQAQENSVGARITSLEGRHQKTSADVVKWDIETKKLKTQTSSIEQAMSNLRLQASESSVSRDEVTSLKSDLAQLKEQVSRDDITQATNKQIVELQIARTASHEELGALHQRVDGLDFVRTIDFDNFERNIEEKFNKITAELERLSSSIDGLKVTVEEPTQSVEDFMTVARSFDAQTELSIRKNEIQDERINDAQKDIRAIQAEFIREKEIQDERIRDVQKDIQAIQATPSHVKALQDDIEKTKADMLEKLSAEFIREKEIQDERIRDAQKDIQAIQATLSHVKALQDDREKTQADLLEKLNAESEMAQFTPLVSPPLSNGGTRLASHLPNEGQLVNERLVQQPGVHGDLQKMKAEFSALQEILRQHKQVLDNTTTDDLFQRIVDRMSIKFSTLKTNDKTLRDLEKNIQEFKAATTHRIDSKLFLLEQELKGYSEKAESMMTEMYAELRKLQEENSKAQGRLRFLEDPSR